MMIVKKFGQLLAQAFVALGLVAENDGAFEQRMLKFLRQIAPEIRGSGSQDEKITRGGVVPLRLIPCSIHGKAWLQS